MAPPVVPFTSRRVPLWVDAVGGVVAAVLAVLVLVTSDLASVDPRLQDPSPLIVGVTAVGALAVGLRRRAPFAGLVVISAAATVVSLTDHFTALLPYLTLFSLYSVGAYGRLRQAVAGTVALLVAFVLLALADVPDLTLGDVVTNGALAVAAAALGHALRSRREHQAELLTTARAEAAQHQAESQRAVADERLRIAREMHDVVAHSMSLIAVQAGVGAHLVEQDPKAAGKALEVIADTSRDALAQARSVIGLLRSGDDAQPSLPGLAALEPLVQGVRDAGLPVRLEVDGTSRVPAAVDLAAYRIVQEALTNAVRHAPGRPVRVHVDHTPRELRIDVLDGDPAAAPLDVPPPAGSGYGLAGLKERAAAVGGELTAGPTADGGFRVSARLPVREAT